MPTKTPEQIATSLLPCNCFSSPPKHYAWCQSLRRPSVAAALRAEREQVDELKGLLERMTAKAERVSGKADGQSDLSRAVADETMEGNTNGPANRAFWAQSNDDWEAFLTVVDEARAYLARTAPEPSPEPPAQGARETGEWIGKARIIALFDKRCPHNAAAGIDATQNRCRDCVMATVDGIAEAYAAERERRRDWEWARAFGRDPDSSYWTERALCEPEALAAYVAEEKHLAVAEALGGGVPITAIKLEIRGDGKAWVRVEYDGTWHDVIRELHIEGGHTSHIVEALGIRRALKEHKRS